MISTHVVKNDQRLSPSTAVVTDGVEDAVAPDGGDQLLNKQGQEDGADRGQDEVVEHEQGVELERREVLHDLATTENHHIVSHQQSRGLLEGGQRGHARDELEFAGGVAHDLLIGLVEERPQVNAKGPIESREGHILEEVGHDGTGRA